MPYHIQEHGVRGIQLFPDIAERFMLLFADDITCIAYTIAGLQRQLNVLQECCNDFKLIVNVTKTKVLVFKKGGRLSKAEQWYGFLYLGVFFSQQMSMFKMAESISVKAKKALNHLFNGLHSLPCIPYETFFKIFYSKISSIRLYVAELWGMTSHGCTEQLQIYASKRFLGANQNACNDAILADLGRFPMLIYSAGRSITFWLRILSLPNDRYLKLCYNMFF